MAEFKYSLFPPVQHSRGDWMTKAYCFRTVFPRAPYPTEVIKSRPPYFSLRDEENHLAAGLVEKYFPGLPPRKSYLPTIFGANPSRHLLDIYDLVGFLDAGVPQDIGPQHAVAAFRHYAQYNQQDVFLMGCLRVPSIAHPPGSPDILNKQDLPRHEARQRRLWVLLSVNTATSACALSWLDMKTEKGFYIAVHKSGDTLLAHASKHYLNSQLRSAGANRDWDFENVPTTPLDNDSNAALLYAIELFRLRILESTDFYQSPSGCPDWRQALYLNHRETAQNVEEWGAEMAMTSLHCQAFSYELGHSNYTRYPDRPLRRSASLQEYKAVQVEAGRVLNITYKPNVTFFVGGVADLPELSIEGDLDRMRRDISAFALEDFRASRAPSLVPSRQQSRESTAPAGPILRSSRGRSISSELSRLPSGTPTDPYSSSPRGTPVGPGPTINLSMQQTARPGRATEAPLHQRLRSSNIMPPSFPDRPQEPRVPLWNELHSLNPIRPSVGSPNWTGFDHAIKMDMYEADCERIRRVRMQNQERTAAAAAARAEFESRRGQRRGQR